MTITVRTAVLIVDPDASEKNEFEIKTKRIDQSKLTSDCWSVQVWGHAACAKCEFLNTDRCGGLNILKRIEDGAFPKDGLPGE